jgi:hypothetical protein
MLITTQKLEVLVKNADGTIVFDSEGVAANQNETQTQALSLLFKVPADNTEYEVDISTFIGVAERVFFSVDNELLVKPVPDGVAPGSAAFFRWVPGPAGFLPSGITKIIVKNDSAEIVDAVLNATGAGAASLPVIITPSGGVPRIAVADIDDPSAELLSQGGSLGDVLLAYQDDDPAQFTFYAFDDTVTAADNAPYLIPGSSGKWVAVSGKYQNNTLNGRDIATDGATLDAHVANVSNPHSVTTTQIGAIPTSEKGAANGVATLDGTGKVPASQLSISGGLSFLGLWDAATNTPALSNGSGNENEYYVVSVAGTTSIDGENDWQVKDWAVFTGGQWRKLDNTDIVSSVAGKVGAVTLVANDVGLANVDNTSDVNKPVSTAQALADTAVQNFAIQRANHTGTQNVSTINGGANNFFAMFSASGVLTDVPGYAYDPSVFNGALWNHTVIPGATTDFKKFHNLLMTANPTVTNSQENWYNLWIESNIGTDVSGNQLGDSINGGLSGFGMALSSRDESDFGYLRNLHTSIQVGNGTDAITGERTYHLDQNTSIQDNSTVLAVQGLNQFFSSEATSTVGTFDGFNLNTNFAGGMSGRYLGINQSGTIASIAAGQYYQGYANFTTISDMQNQFQGIALGPNVTFTGLVGDLQMIDVFPTATNVNEASGLRVNMSGVSGNNVRAINATGRCEFTANHTAVDGGGQPFNIHNVNGNVSATVSTTNADSISMGMTQLINVGPGAVLTSGAFQLGVSAMTMVVLPTIGAGGSIDYVAGATAALNLQGAVGAGTIGEWRGFRSSIVPDGNTTVARAKGFFHHEPFGSAGYTTSWGLYSRDTEHNFIENGLRIGGVPDTSDTVTNTSIGLDMFDRAVKFANIDTTARDALTAVNGMVIYNTTTNKFQGYENGSWVDLI